MKGFSRRTKSLSERAACSYNDSSGNFDTDAKQALDLIDQIPDEQKTSADRLHRAQIRDLNAAGGNLHRSTRDDAKQIIDDYGYAMRLAAEEQAAETDNHIIHPVFILEEVGGFVERNRPVLAAHFGGFMNAFMNTNTTVHTRDTAERAQTAAASAVNRRDYTDKYVNSSTRHTNDPQSAHDSAVNVSLRKTMHLLRTTTPIILSDKDARQDAAEFIDGCNISDDKKASALRSLSELSRGSLNTTIDSDEMEVFQLVWSRTYDPANAENAENLREAVVLALADFRERDPVTGIPRDNPVCVNGRCSRMLESLALLDHDSEISGAQTVEERKNTIFEAVRMALDDEIRKAKQSPNADMKAVGASYEDPDITTSPEAEAAFKENLHTRIDRILGDHQQYFSREVFETVKKDAHAAVA